MRVDFDSLMLMMLCGYDDVDLDDILIVSLKKENDRIEEKKHSRYKKFFLNGCVSRSRRKGKKTERITRPISK